MSEGGKKLTSDLFKDILIEEIQELMTNAYELKQLQGPIYMQKEHKFIPDPSQKADLPEMNHPYRGTQIQSKNVYVPDKPNPNSHPEPLMIGPRLPGVIQKNQYCGDYVPDLEMERVMAPPAYRGFNIEARSEYHPDTPAKPHEPLMHGPKMPNIEESHKYNPMTERVKGPIQQSAPVYTGIEIHNEYNLVEKRVEGVPILAGPKYPGVETKNSFVPEVKKIDKDKVITAPVKPVEVHHKFQPPLDKVPGELAMTAPVYR